MKSDAQAAPDSLGWVFCRSISGNGTGTWGPWRLTTGSALLRLVKSNGDEGVCNNGVEFEAEKKLAASLMFSLETGLAWIRNDCFVLSCHIHVQCQERLTWPEGPARFRS